MKKKKYPVEDETVLDRPTNAELTRIRSVQSTKTDRISINLILHFIIFLTSLKVIIIVVVVFLGELLCGLRKVNFTATSATAILDDVPSIDLLHVILIRLVG
jgi:ABC-type proline/glycine betaine transport system permease subunit